MYTIVIASITGVFCASVLVSCRRYCTYRCRGFMVLPAGLMEVV